MRGRTLVPALALAVGWLLAPPESARAVPTVVEPPPLSLVHLRLMLPYSQVSLYNASKTDRLLPAGAIVGYQWKRLITEISAGAWKHGRDLALRGGGVPWRFDNRRPDVDGVPSGWLLQLEILGGWRQLAASEFTELRNRLTTLTAIDLIYFSGGDGLGLSARLAAGFTVAPTEASPYNVLQDYGVTFGVAF